MFSSINHINNMHYMSSSVAKNMKETHSHKRTCLYSFILWSDAKLLNCGFNGRYQIITKYRRKKVDIKPDSDLDFLCDCLFFVASSEIWMFVLSFTAINDVFKFYKVYVSVRKLYRFQNREKNTTES